MHFPGARFSPYPIQSFGDCVLYKIADVVEDTLNDFRALAPEVLPVIEVVIYARSPEAFYKMHTLMRINQRIIEYSTCDSFRALIFMRQGVPCLYTVMRTSDPLVSHTF